MVSMYPVAWSFCGRVGRLLASEDALYRTIMPERVGFYKSLFDQGVIQELVRKGLFVDSELLSQEGMGEHGFLIRHRRIPFPSYPFEWCDQMLKDAGLFFLRLNVELLSFNLVVRDAHPWNILFDGPNPVFVDLGSIIPVEDVNLSAFIEDFHRFFLRPLELFSRGQSRIARVFLREWRTGVLGEDLVQFMGRRPLWPAMYQSIKKRVPSPLRKLLRRLRDIAPLHPVDAASAGTNKEAVKKVLDTLWQQVEVLKFQHSSPWPDYYETYFSFPDFTRTQDWNRKQIVVHNILHEVKPRSVLDIGSNRGWYSQLAAREGSTVVSFDTDEAAIRSLYVDARQQNLPILPLLMDFVWPSPAFGLLEFWPAATQRFKVDLVMALALIHHLTHAEAMWFDHIVEGLSRFTKQWLLVEFIPYEDPLLSQWNCPRYKWYTMDQFLETLRRYFSVVKTTESYPSARTLILCKKLEG